ncbi:MAG: DUF2971 domain-containing protein [Thermoguttaceae bacterium]
MILPDVKHLYIYKPANQFTERIFQNMCLWSAKPKRFNDPFDCDLEVTKGITEEDMMDTVHALYGQCEKWPPGITKFVDSIVDKGGKFTQAERARLDQEIQTVIDDNNNSGVVCLSEVNDSILMWSHYAQHHTGVCIEFERTPNSWLGDPEICMPVQYSSKYPVIDFGKMLLNRDGQTLNLMMRYKADCWAYEKEWRVITDHGDKPCALVGNISKVIFGLRTTDATRAAIQALCNTKGIRTVQAARAPREFRIVIPD